MQAKFVDHFLLNLQNISRFCLAKNGPSLQCFRSSHTLHYPSVKTARETWSSRTCQAGTLQNLTSDHQLVHQLCLWKHTSKLDSFSCNENNYKHLYAHIQLRYVSSNTGDDKTKNLPNQYSLQNVQSFMTEQISKFFTSRHEYRIYTKDLILENHWDLRQPYTVIGLTSYALKVLKVRTYLNFKYARLKMNVLSSSIHEDLGCVCIRWQVGGLPQLKAFMFWKYMPFRIRKTANKELEWIDGLSTFFVNKQGFIYKHRIDRVIIDRQESETKERKKSDLGDVGTAAI